MSAARLELKLLGGFRARIGDGPPVEIAGKKTQALLAYLALAKSKAQSREKLLGLLWSDRAQEQARNSLRQALAEIGRALVVMESSPILKDHDWLALDARTVRIDALEFERLAAAAEAGDLQRAAALYEGDLLDGIAVRDPAFEEWLLVERQRLRNLAMATLKTLLGAETGPSAAAAAHRLLALDPLQEAGHRALIRLHADAGEIGAALRQYEACRDLLKRELDVAPSAETEQLYREIRSRSGTSGGRGSPADASGPAPRPAQQAPPPKPSIAVLPFGNLSGDPDQQYFSDGITEDIITELSRFHQLIVIARHSSFQFREQGADLKRIGRELNVQYVVEGSIRKFGDRVRITAQLIDAANGSHLWAERYDRGLADLFDLQDEVARMIASALAVRLELEDLAKAKRKPPESMHAYDYWLRGKKCLDLWTRAANAEARQLFMKSIESDPEYARGYAGLAYTYEWGAFYTAWDAEGSASSEKAYLNAEKAVALDDTDHLPHVTLAWVHHERGEFEQAQQHLARATAINPNDADTMMNKAMMLALEAKPEAALDLAQFAVRLNPRHPDWYIPYLGGCFFRACRYAEAAAIWERTPDAVPEVRAILAAAYVLAGHPDEARRHMDVFLKRFSLHWTGRPSVRSFAAKVFSYTDPADVQRFGDALQKAGMPE